MIKVSPSLVIFRGVLLSVMHILFSVLFDMVVIDKRLSENLFSIVVFFFSFQCFNAMLLEKLNEIGD